MPLSVTPCLFTEMLVDIGVACVLGVMSDASGDIIPLMGFMWCTLPLSLVDHGDLPFFPMSCLFFKVPVHFISPQQCSESLAILQSPFPTLSLVLSTSVIQAALKFMILLPQPIDLLFCF